MRKDIQKYFRLSLCESQQLETISKTYDISMSAIIRNWINGTPLISLEKKKKLNWLKLIVRNTRANANQIGRLIQENGGNRNDVIAISLYKRDLKDVHWEVRENCYNKDTSHEGRQEGQG